VDASLVSMRGHHAGRPGMRPRSASSEQEGIPPVLAFAPMRRLRVPVIVALVGAGLWPYGTVIVFGSISGESRDSSQRATVVATGVPSWVSAIRTAGAVLVFAAMSAGVARAVRSSPR
jgi:hypothetical protein